MAMHQVPLQVLVLFLIILSPLVLANNQLRPVQFKDILYKSRSQPLQDVRLATYNVSSACEAEIDRLIHGNPQTLETDIVMALDAFGKPPAGILQANWAWLGHYDECMAIDGFNYCLVDMAVNATMLGKSVATAFGGLQRIDIRWGICPPVNCSEDDIHAVLTNLLDATKILDTIGAQSKALTEAGVVCTKSPPIPYSFGFICAVIVCCVLASLMIFGALYDEYLKLSAKNPQGKLVGLAFSRPWRLLDETVETDDDDAPLILDGGAGSTVNSDRHASKKQSLAVRLLLCFALNRNLAKLMDVKQGDSSLRALNGIRVISMFWVILGHTLVFGISVNITDNTLTLLDWLQHHAGFQAVANAFFSVDSFFFLSGFLIAYITFGRFRELNSAKKWALFYFHRYWRLTPLFAFTILIWMYIPQFFGEGPVWQTGTARPFCPQYWWSGLLYISNFWPTGFGNECIAWTWYLANDMQFFVISPLLMAPLFYFPVIGWLALIATLLASFLSTGLIIGMYDLKLTLLEQVTQTHDYSSLVYGKPYCRIAPYLVGLGLGYIMHRIGKRRVTMSPVLALVGWLAAAGMALSVVYGLYPSYHTPMSKAAIIVYGSICRFVWALSLAWLVFACKYGYGGWVNSFLSWGAWVPLARVTFSAYMFHPIVIEIFFSNFATNYHFSVYLMAFQFAGLVSVSYFIAVLVALAIEYPCANLEKIMLPTQPRTKKNESYQEPTVNGVVEVNVGLPDK